MTNKCTKYETLFTFADEKTFLEHIENCPDCKAEHERMQKVSELIRNAKPYFIQKRRNFAKVKAACAIFVMFLSATTLGVINLNTDISDTIRYGTTLSAEDLGIPVDSYGLVMVDEF